MTSPPFPHQDAQGNRTDSEPQPWTICPSSRTPTIVLGFEKREGTLAGFEPPASQDRGNINQPALLDLLHKTILINRITENSLIYKRTRGRINKLAKIHVPVREATKPFENFNWASRALSFEQFTDLESLII